MSPAPDPAPLVEVTAAEDGVAVSVVGRPAAPPPFASAVLDADGALLTWPDVTGPGLPDAHLDDASAAQAWLWDLYGPGTARAVAAAGPAPLRVRAAPGALARPLAALALGHWAARWWPASRLDGVPALDPDLLGLELAALAHRCHRALPPDEAADLLLEHRAGIGALLEEDPPGLAAALAAVADAAGLDGEGVDALLGAAPPPAAPARPDGYALAAGPGAPGPARTLARGHGANDWCRYPAGFVDAAEDAVSWTVLARGAARVVEVRAVAGPLRPSAAARPVAEVAPSAGTAPLLVPLAPDGDAWAGSAGLDLPATAVPDPRVAVLLPGFDPGPSGPGAAAARDRLRALAARRLDLARGAPAGPGEPPPFAAEVRAARDDEDF
ncbi:hypothetical protein ACFVWN_21685 [Nocardiopsis flavescens]|uniref:hypothetical protein n=2 Tax=Nocardiopsis flavescens TaxID=758803 RepID=UPI0036DF4B71